MISRVLKNLNLFVDGNNFAGKVKELVPPVLTLVTEDERNGGMDGTDDIDLGLEKMTAEFTLSGYEEDALSRWGLSPGNTVPLVFRAGLESDDGSVIALVITMTAKIRSADLGTWTPGQKSEPKFMATVTYYKLEHGGQTLIEIDVNNMIRTIGGTDQLASTRQALGI